MTTPTVFDDAVEILGSEDTPQLTVRGHLTQDEPLQVWQDASADDLAQLSGDGRLRLGDLDLGTPNAFVETDAEITLPSTRPQRAWGALGRISGTITEAINWVVHELELLGSGGVSGLHTALRVRLTQANTGNADEAQLRAGDFEVTNEGGSDNMPVGQLTGLHAEASNTSGAYLDRAVGVEGAISNAGDITEAAAFEVAPPVNTGTIDTLYGLRIPDLDEGGENFAIHSGLGPVHLGDYLELKRPAATPGQPATDLIRIYPGSDGKLYARNWDNQEFDLTIGSGESVASGDGGGSSGSLLPIEGFLVSCDDSEITISSGICQASGSQAYFRSDANITIDPTNSGVNGLDAGTLASNTWYFVYVISDGTTTAGLLSTSQTSPVVPLGYPMKRRVGAVRRVADRFLNQYTAVGDARRTVWYDEEIQDHTDGSSNAPFTLLNQANLTSAWANVDVSALVPPTSEMGLFSIEVITSSGSIAVYYRRPGHSQSFRFGIGRGANDDHVYLALLPLGGKSNRTIDVKSQDNAASLDEDFSLYALGYVEDLIDDTTQIPLPETGDLPCIVQGRLSISATNPVPVSDITGATTLYFLPYKGDRVSLYDGVSWLSHTIPADGISASVPASTDTNYDVFLNEDSGTLELEFVAWTDETTRATSLAKQNGVYVKSGDATRLYLGSLRTTGTNGQCEDSLTKRLVYNYHNRVRRPLFKWVSDYHSAANFSWRPWANDTGNSVGVLCGVAEGFWQIDLATDCRINTDYPGQFSVGVDSSTTPSTVLLQNYFYNTDYTYKRLASGAVEGILPEVVGLHTLYVLEEYEHAATLWSSFYSLSVQMEA